MDKTYEEIRVTLNENGKETVKIFNGNLLSRIRIDGDGIETVYRLYETPRGKLACVVRTNPLWQSSGTFDDEQWGDVSRDPQWWRPHYQLHVADNDEELERQIGADVVKVLREGATPQGVEYLDI